MKNVTKRQKCRNVKMQKYNKRKKANYEKNLKIVKKRKKWYKTLSLNITWSTCFNFLSLC